MKTPVDPARTEKREAILKAAVKLIAEYGFHGAPIAMVAQEAGVGAGTIYRYFKDKDDLVLAVFHGIDHQLHQALADEYDRTLPLRDRFLHLCRRFFHFGVAHPDEFKFVEQFYHSPYGAHLRREKQFCRNGSVEEGAFAQVFCAGQQQEVIKDLPVAALFPLAIGPIAFLVKDHINGVVALDQATLEQTFAACWDAVRR